MIQFTCTGNVGNRVKQRENLKKKLKGVVSQQVLLKFVSYLACTPNMKIIIVTRQINVYVRVVATFQKLQTEFLKFQEQ